MRVIVFFIYLFIHLGGGNAVHAATHPNRSCYSSVQDLTENKQVKFTNTDHNTTLIEDADFDLDEESFSDNHLKEKASDKLFFGKYNLSGKWYLELSHPYILNYYFRHFKAFPPFSGYSSPIYIRQRVLRI